MGAVDRLHAKTCGVRVLLRKCQPLCSDRYEASIILTLLQLEYPVLVLVFVVSTVTGLVVSLTELVV